jgi:hypothetical protein
MAGRYGPEPAAPDDGPRKRATMPRTPRRDPPPRRRTRAEAEAAIAQGEEQLARYLGHLERRRADGLDTTSAELLVRVIERQLAMASWGRLRPSKEGDNW